MKRFSSNMYFQKVIFKRCNYLGFQNWFVGSGSIAVRSVVQAFKERHYDRSMRLHKEGFHVPVQRRVEDITEKFELIHPDLVSNVSELMQRPSRKALEPVTNIKE